MTQALADVITQTLHVIDLAMSVFVDLDTIDQITYEGNSLVRAISEVVRIMVDGMASVIEKL